MSYPTVVDSSTFQSIFLRPNLQPELHINHTDHLSGLRITLGGSTGGSLPCEAKLGAPVWTGLERRGQRHW